MFQKLSELKDLVAQSSICRKLALAVSQDEHSLEAVHAAYKAGFITPILIGSRVATEKIIADKLRSLGYTVHTDIGCSGYKIDIGIKSNFLKTENRRLKTKKQTPWCGDSPCYKCGPCN